MTTPAFRAIAGLAVLLSVAACGGGGGGGGGPGKGRALPVVESVTPPHGSVGVDPGTTVLLRFRTSMDDATLLGGSLVLTPAGTHSPVPAVVTVAPGGTSATLDPGGPLAAGLLYQVRLSADARRSDGRTIGRPWFSEFRVDAGGPPPPPPPPAQGGSVRGVGPLARGRSGHAAVALPGGGVAVFGGFDTSSSVTGTIEVYDPVAEEWTTSAASLLPARARLSATLLGDGRVLLAGGETASTTDVGLDRWEIYDPSLDAVTASGSMVERRTRHRAVRLGDGRVLLVGGSRTDTPGAPNFSRSTTEIFDPGTAASSAGPSMTVTRAGHEATLLGDGRVLVTGGHGSNPLSEVYDPSGGSFSSGGNMVDVRRDHGATLLQDGGVLATGGGNFTAERWIPAENRWVQVQNMGDVRSLHTAVRIDNGRVFLAGGEKPGVGGGVAFHDSTEFYNPGTSSFLFPDLRTRIQRTGHTATPLSGGRWLLVGGKNGILGAPSLRSCDLFTF